MVKTAITAIGAAVLALSFGAPAFADTEKGEVAEILVKVMTPDGPRWYKLGADLSKIDVSEGQVIEFSYENDTIDAVTVLPEGQEKTEGN